MTERCTNSTRPRRYCAPPCANGTTWQRSCAIRPSTTASPACQTARCSSTGVETALGRAGRIGGEVVILLIDLDDFKPVNDRLGHASGDELLKQVGQRLRRCLRETDTAARIGGDEFAVVLEEPVAEGFTVVAERVLRALQTPFVVGEEQVVVHASVGVAVDRNGAHESGDLLREADVAMYAAKHQGKAGFQVFTQVSPPGLRRPGHG